MSAPRTTSRRGVFASASASAIFGGIFVLPPHLLPLQPEQILGYRIVAMIVFLSLMVTALRIWGQVGELARRLRAAPHLVGVLALDAGLLGAQLWLFGWAPQTGHGLEVSLGYLILPLVMVLVSVKLYRDALSLIKTAAVVIAAAGVAAAVAFAGGIGWPTLLVALGFPPYFILRRAFDLDSAGAQLLELFVMLTFSSYTFIAEPSWAMVGDRPGLVLGLLLLGVLSAVGFALYLTASRLLPFAVFGVLSYLEPVLLVLVSLTFLDESWTTADTATYIPICAALLLLALEAPVDGRRTRRASRSRAESTAGDRPVTTS